MQGTNWGGTYLQNIMSYMYIPTRKMEVELFDVDSIKFHARRFKGFFFCLSPWLFLVYFWNFCGGKGALLKRDNNFVKVLRFHRFHTYSSSKVPQVPTHSIKKMR